MKANLCYSYLIVIFLIGDWNTALARTSELPRELPRELDTFENILTKNRVYVDKSRYVPKLLNRDNRFVRMCRPRRFGKSNFLQMLNSFFKGDKKFFAGSPVHAEHDWRPCPVIYLDFNIMNVTTLQDFKLDMRRTLSQIGKLYNVDIYERDPPEVQIQQLVEWFSEKGTRPQSVVVLVDEYDWPMRYHDDMDAGDGAETMSAFLKKFFGRFKNMRESVKLLFLTCTMPLELVDPSTTEGLKGVEDLTFDPEFDGMIGLTHAELTSHFEPHINAMTKNRTGETFHNLVESLRQRYDGYCFSRNTNNSGCRLYNFHSVISCLREQKFENVWHASRKTKYNLIEDFRKRRLVLNVFTKRWIQSEYLRRPFDFDEMTPMVVCMLLHGYLTFSNYDEKYDEYEVDFPNEEIRETFVKEMMKPLPAGRRSTSDILSECKKLEVALSTGKMEDFFALLNNIAFESQNLTAIDADNEFEYTERISRLLLTCDIHCTHAGNYFLDVSIDLVIQMPEEIEYVFEFEWKKSAEHAFNKLLKFTKMQGFQDNFAFNNVFLVGANFAKESGLIDEWIRVTHFQRKCSDLKTSNSRYLETFSYIGKTKACLPL